MGRFRQLSTEAILDYTPGSGWISAEGKCGRTPFTTVNVVVTGFAGRPTRVPAVRPTRVVAAFIEQSDHVLLVEQQARHDPGPTADRLAET
jgi:hypothetical protein